MELQDLKTIFEKGGLETVEIFLDSYKGVKNADYWILKGSINQKKQDWGNAINAFQKALEIDPENKNALSHLEIIKSIMNFWNPEMFGA